MDKKNEPVEFWHCIVGPARRSDFNRTGADAPMRTALCNAFENLTDYHPAMIYSSWGNDTVKSRLIQQFSLMIDEYQDSVKNHTDLANDTRQVVSSVHKRLQEQMMFELEELCELPKPDNMFYDWVNKANNGFVWLAERQADSARERVDYLHKLYGVNEDRSDLLELKREKVESHDNDSVSEVEYDDNPLSDKNLTVLDHTVDPETIDQMKELADNLASR